MTHSVSPARPLVLAVVGLALVFGSALRPASGATLSPVPCAYRILEQTSEPSVRRAILGQLLEAHLAAGQRAMAGAAAAQIAPLELADPPRGYRPFEGECRSVALRGYAAAGQLDAATRFVSRLPADARDGCLTSAAIERLDAGDEDTAHVLFAAVRDASTAPPWLFARAPIATVLALAAHVADPEARAKLLLGACRRRGDPVTDRDAVLLLDEALRAAETVADPGRRTDVVLDIAALLVRVAPDRAVALVGRYLPPPSAGRTAAQRCERALPILIHAAWLAQLTHDGGLATSVESLARAFAKGHADRAGLLAQTLGMLGRVDEALALVAPPRTNSSTAWTRSGVFAHVALGQAARGELREARASFARMTHAGVLRQDTRIAGALALREAGATAAGEALLDDVEADERATNRDDDPAYLRWCLARLGRDDPRWLAVRLRGARRIQGAGERAPVLAGIISDLASGGRYQEAEALRDELPTPHEVAQARSEFGTAISLAALARTGGHRGWEGFVEVLPEIDPAGRVPILLAMEAGAARAAREGRPIPPAALDAALCGP